MENQLPATLEYLREYRTYTHIEASYGIAESNMYRSIKWAEETLIKQRIYIEHAIMFVKRFHILSERYRNRRKRFAPRFF
jgi:hypothetical protein